MKLGVYRTTDPILGEAARVHQSAGDAAPYLSRYLYELLEFRPAFDCLPCAGEEPGLVPPRLRALPGPAPAPPHVT